MKVALLGAGDLGVEIASAISNDPQYSFIGFYDDDIHKDTVFGDSYLGKIESEIVDPSLSYLISIASSQQKKEIAQAHQNLQYISFVHVRSNLEARETINIGKGSIIASGVQATCNISIGDHVLVNLNSTIGHDVKIGHYTSIMPGVNISGNVTIGEGVLIGSGAVLLQGIKIGDGAVIGAGSVVTKDVDSQTTVMGVPAKEVVV